MKNGTPDLFDFIKSLTNSEKRYFTLYSQRHYNQDNNSLRLFQIIGKQLQYSEADAIKESGMARNNFAVQKNLLYDQILTALLSFDLAGDELQKVQQDIFACRKLLQKGLLAQAKSKLKSTRSSAAKYELHEATLQLLQIESAIHAREQYKTTSAESLGDWYRETSQALKKLEIENYCKHTNSCAQKIQIDAGGKGPAYADAVKKLLDEATIFLAEEPLTARSQMDLLQTEALYYFMAQNVKKAHELNGKFLDLMESAPHWIVFYPQRYFSALNNYLIDCFQLKNETTMKAGIDKMRALRSHPAFKKTINLEANIFRITYQLELNFAIAGGLFTAALPAVDMVLAAIDTYQDKIPAHHRMNLQYLCAYVLFAKGAYSRSSYILDHIQQQQRNETPTILDNVVAIMQVLCHYELGNFSILEGLVKSAKRKLTNHKSAIDPAGEFELLNVILLFSVKESTPAKWKRVLTKMYQTSLPKSPYLVYFDYITYVLAKMHKTDFEKVFRLKE